MRPNALTISFLTKLCKIIPTWKIIPTQDIIDIAFKVPEIRKQVFILISSFDFIIINANNEK